MNGTYMCSNWSLVGRLQVTWSKYKGQNCSVVFSGQADIEKKMLSSMWFCPKYCPGKKRCHKTDTTVSILFCAADGLWVNN